MRRLLTIFILSLLFAGVVKAVPVVYTNIASGYWSATSTWKDGNAPPVGGSSNTWIFTSAGSVITTITNDLAGTFVLNQIRLGLANRACTMYGNSLLFTNDGSTLPGITNTQTAPLLIYNPIILTTNFIVDDIVGGSIQTLGSITETTVCSVTKTNTANWLIWECGYWTGGTFVNGGGAQGLNFMTTNPVGSGPITVNNSSIAFRTNDNAFANNIIVNSGTVVFNMRSNVNFVGIISGSSTLVKGGASNMVLKSANTFSGSLIVSQGVLRADVANAFSTNMTLYITSGATNYLNFTGINVIKDLYLNGARQPFGTYGTNNCQYTNTTYFLGNGVLQNYVDARYKMKITFTNYNKTETLTNFPTLVVLSNNMSSSGFNFNTVASTNGYDLEFWDDDETTKLNHEIESWSTGVGSYVWVQITNFTNNCYVWAKWGDPSITSAPAYTTNGSTWNSGFVGVWHMTQTNVIDSSTNVNNGTAFGNTNATGYIGTCQEFKANYIRVTNSASFGNMNAISVSYWFKPVGSRHYPINKTPDFCCWDNGAGWNNISLFVGWGYVCNEVYTASAPISRNAWHYFCGTWSNSATAGQIRIYADGRLDATGANSYTGTITSVSNMTIASASFTGLVDEVRIENVQRSSNWLWACWFSQISNSVFNTYNQVQQISITASPRTLLIPFYVNELGYQNELWPR